MAALNRIRKELKEMTSNPPPQCTAAPIGQDMFEWEASVGGPPDTPYSGGVFRLSVKFPQNYPMKPPEVKFITRVYHPNITSGGQIYLDIFDESWTCAMSLSAVLLSIQQLLSEPNANSGSVIGTQMKTSPEEFINTAKQWTLKYAKPNRVANTQTNANTTQSTGNTNASDSNQSGSPIQ